MKRRVQRDATVRALMAGGCLAASLFASAPAASAEVETPALDGARAAGIEAAELELVSTATATAPESVNAPAAELDARGEADPLRFGSDPRALAGRYVDRSGARLVLTERDGGLVGELTRDGARLSFALGRDGEAFGPFGPQALIGRIGGGLVRLERPGAAGEATASSVGRDLGAPADGVSLVWIPIEEAGPALDRAQVSTFVRDRGVQPAAVGRDSAELGAASRFVEAYSEWAPRQVAAAYRRLTDRARALISLFPHVRADMLLRICRAGGAAAAAAGEPYGVCATLAPAPDGPAAEQFAAALAAERSQLLAASKCAVGGLPRSRCLATWRDVGGESREIGDPATVLRRYRGDAAASN